MEQVKLICVKGGENNNKYYNMIKNGDNTFTAVYGRVNVSEVRHTYPMYLWEKKYAEKLKKGYNDVTNLSISASINGATINEENPEVDSFIKKMFLYTRDLIDKTYVNDTATPQQIEEAQSLINEIMKLDNDRMINSILEKLYVTIPRKMKKVKDCLLPNIDIVKHLQNEQDNIDALRSNIIIDTNKQSFLETINAKIDINSNDLEFKYITKQISENRINFKKIFNVDKHKDSLEFNDFLSSSKNKQTRYLIHGTRPSSVIPILKDKLRIRPSGNFQFSGKAYGDGNYFSEVVKKSMNYVGYEKDKILLIYEVHVGNPFVYNGWYTGNSFTLNYENLKKRGYDSTYVKAGNGLLNSEIISYNENQCRIKNIIWL